LFIQEVQGPLLDDTLNDAHTLKDVQDFLQGNTGLGTNIRFSWLWGVCVGDVELCHDCKFCENCV
jgi:hypothetical protein